MTGVNRARLALEVMCPDSMDRHMAEVVEASENPSRAFRKIFMATGAFVTDASAAGCLEDKSARCKVNGFRLGACCPQHIFSTLEDVIEPPKPTVDRSDPMTALIYTLMIKRVALALEQLGIRSYKIQQETLRLDAMARSLIAEYNTIRASVVERLASLRDPSDEQDDPVDFICL